MPETHQLWGMNRHYHLEKASKRGSTPIGWEQQSLLPHMLIFAVFVVIVGKDASAVSITKVLASDHRLALTQHRGESESRVPSGICHFFTWETSAVPPYLSLIIWLNVQEKWPLDNLLSFTRNVKAADKP